jgi:mannose/fructose/N-acetylgalactosamine-specific phosphotransferase system component IIC
VVFQHKADDYAEEGNLFGIGLCNYGALLLQGLRVGIPALLVAMTVGTGAVEDMLNAIPPVISGGLQVAGGFIVVVGYAMVINMMGAQYLMPFFFLGFVVAAFTNFNLVALGVIGLVCAVVYVQLNPKYQEVAAAPAAAASSSDLDDELD